MRNIVVVDFEKKPGEIIRSLRGINGVSMKQLAEKTGLSKSGLYRWENGERVPTVDVFLRIVQALDSEVIVVKKTRGIAEAGPSSKEVNKC